MPRQIASQTASRAASRATITALGTIILTSLSFATPCMAEDRKLDFGLRTDIGLGNGEPTNDIIGYSLFGHYRLNARWNLGFGVDHSPEFDFERTPDVLGLMTPEVIDAKGTSTTLSAWIERVYPRPGGKMEWFWSVGLGVNQVEVDDLAGPLVGGGTFDITTDAGTELQAMAGVGFRYWFGQGGWGLEGAAHIDQHFADWTVTDRISGATGSIDDYTVNSFNIGVLKRF